MVNPELMNMLVKSIMALEKDPEGFLAKAAVETLRPAKKEPTADELAVEGFLSGLSPNLQALIKKELQMKLLYQISTYAQEKDLAQRRFLSVLDQVFQQREFHFARPEWGSW